jgi:hypothetical protein
MAIKGTVGQTVSLLRRSAALCNPPCSCYRALGLDPGASIRGPLVPVSFDGVPDT